LICEQHRQIEKAICPFRGEQKDFWNGKKNRARGRCGSSPGKEKGETVGERGTQPTPRGGKKRKRVTGQGKKKSASSRQVHRLVGGEILLNEEESQANVTTIFTGRKRCKGGHHFQEGGLMTELRAHYPDSGLGI